MPLRAFALRDPFGEHPPYRIGAPDRTQFLGTIKLQPSRSTQNLTFFFGIFWFFLKHVEARCKKPSNPIKCHQIPSNHHISSHIISYHIITYPHYKIRDCCFCSWSCWGCFYIVLLHALRKNQKCQKKMSGFGWTLRFCNFIEPKNCLLIRGSNSIEGVLSKRIPRGKGKGTQKDTVEAASAASAAETAVPNFIVGICDDMIWKWYVMICGDLMGFDGIWWDLMASYIVLLHALRKTKKMWGCGWTLRAAIL